MIAGDYSVQFVVTPEAMAAYRDAHPPFAPRWRLDDSEVAVRVAVHQGLVRTAAFVLHPVARHAPQTWRFSQTLQAVRAAEGW